MNYVALLYPVTSLPSLNAKELDYSLIIQRDLWRRICLADIGIRRIFSSPQNSEYLSFLKWLVDNKCNYNWQLGCNIIKYFEDRRKSLTYETILSLLINAAKEWGNENITEYQYICFYVPSQVKKMVIYQKSHSKCFQPKIRICKGANLYQANDARVSSYILYSVGHSLMDLPDLILRV